MRSYIARSCLVFLCCLALPAVAVEPSILGTWQNTNDPLDFRLYKTGNIYQSNDNGELSVFPVLGYEEGRIVIPDLGQGMRGGFVINYTLQKDILTITKGKSILNGILRGERNTTFQRVTDDAADMTLKGTPMGPKKSRRLDKDTAKAISESLITRMQRDQKSRSSGKYGDEAIKGQADDYTWLKETIIQHGWIDTKRFGPQAVQSAFLIAQHCVDMRLRLAAQQGLKKDMESGSPVHGMHAWIYDRSRLFYRGNQRYGTHYRQLRSGAIEILPLESISKVDSWRKKARMPSWVSLKEALAHHSANKRVIIADSLRTAHQVPSSKTNK